MKTYNNKRAKNTKERLATTLSAERFSGRNKVRHETLLHAIRLRVPIITILFLLTTTLIGCSLSSTSAKQFNQYTGSNGVTIAFQKDMPPAKIYEGRPFPVSFEIYNQGSQEVNYSDMRVLFSYDPLYLSGGISPFNPQTYDPDKLSLRSRSLAYPDGEKKVFSIPLEAAFSANNVYGQRTSPDTALTASVCYRYATQLSTSVCVDASSYLQNARKQLCTAKDQPFTNQGAPIAITKVVTNAIPYIDKTNDVQAIRPEFTITMQDVGNGYLIGPDNLSLESACLLKSIPKEQLKAVKVRAWLLKTELDCGVAPAQQRASGLAVFYDNKAEIVCTVPADKMSSALYATTQNFATILTINVTYLYKASISQPIQINRIPGNTDTYFPIWMYGKRTGLMYMSDLVGVSMPAGFHEGPAPQEGSAPVADASGNGPKAETPIYNDKNQQASKCEFYSQNPQLVPASAKQITKLFGCSCGKEQCVQLGNQCIYGFCPGDSYCCDNSIPAPVASGGNSGLSTVGSGDVSGTIANINKLGIMDVLKSNAQQNGIDERLIIAQVMAESGGASRVVTFDGGVGISQFTENNAVHGGTRQYFTGIASDVELNNIKICICPTHSKCTPEQAGCNLADPRLNPDYSVRAEIKYMKDNFNRYSSYTDKMYFAIAAYNTGPGNVDKAISKAKSATGDADPRWDKVKPYVNQQYTVPYVTRIIAAYTQQGGTVS